MFRVYYPITQVEESQCFAINTISFGCTSSLILETVYCYHGVQIGVQIGFLCVSNKQQFLRFLSTKFTFTKIRYHSSVPPHSFLELFIVIMAFKKDFYVYLPTNSSFDFFPQNSLSHYFTVLRERIRLHSAWEVALCEIQYSATWKNIDDGRANMRLRRKDRNRTAPDADDDDANNLLLKIPTGHYRTAEVLVKEIDRRCTISILPTKKHVCPPIVNIFPRSGVFYFT